MWLADAATFSLALVALMALLYLQNRPNYSGTIHIVFTSMPPTLNTKKSPAAYAAERVRAFEYRNNDDSKQTFHNGANITML